MSEVVSGLLEVKDPGTDRVTITLDAQLPEVIQGGGPFQPAPFPLPPLGQQGANVYVDAAGATVGLYDPKDGTPRVTLSGYHQQLLFRDLTKKMLEVGVGGGYASVLAGGNGQHGRIMLYPNDGDIPKGGTANVVLTAETAAVIAGGGGKGGWIGARDGDGFARITIQGEPEQLLLSDQAGQSLLGLWIDPGKSAYILAGGHGHHGRLLLYPDTGDIWKGDTANIILSAETGDIILKNADCAEEFDVPESANVDPGTVMVIEDEGSLRPSTVAYDPRVAGVVSGAAELRPGIVLGRQPDHNDRLPIAMVGKVYCKADARHAAIEVGDLLTTSPTPGHAMKAADRVKAFGAVLGKALRPLNEGTGLIPVLVALQ